MLGALWAADAALVGFSLEVINGFLVEQVSSSSNKQFVSAFSTVWALVSAVETVELKLSQERFESCLVESSLEDFDKGLFIRFVSISVNLE